MTLSDFGSPGWSLWHYCSQECLDYLFYQSFDFEHTWSRWFQRWVVCTKFHVYVFIDTSDKAAVVWRKHYAHILHRRVSTQTNAFHNTPIFLDKYHQYSWFINSTSKRHILSKKYPYYTCIYVLATQITQNTFPFSLYCSLEQMFYHKKFCSPNNRLTNNQATCYTFL